MYEISEKDKRKWEETMSHVEHMYKIPAYKVFYGRVMTMRSRASYPYNLLFDFELYVMYVIDGYIARKPEEMNLDDIFKRITREEESYLIRFYKKKSEISNISKRTAIFKKVLKTYDASQRISPDFKKDNREKIWRSKKTPVCEGNLRSIHLSPRSVNALNRAGIFNVNQLIELSLPELKKVRGIGKETYTDIVRAVEKLKVG